MKYSKFLIGGGVINVLVLLYKPNPFICNPNLHLIKKTTSRIIKYYTHRRVQSRKLWNC